MNIRVPLVVASIVLSSTWALAAEADCPRPDLWDRYPQIKQEVDHGLAKLKDTLAAFEPEVFFAKHPALAKMAQSADWAQRVRALKAIAALEDPTGIPLLVAGIMDAKDEKSLNEAMDPLTTWIATRWPRDRFKPLAPLFLNILVSTPDWPSVRCRCLQALGNLADCDWLPIIRELLVSRHPAVTNMSTWVIQQVSSRAGARVCSVTVTQPGSEPWVEERVWYNSTGAPILSARYGAPNQPYCFQWGDYDRRGLLRRVVQLKGDFSLMSVTVHENGPKYCWTVIREFGPQGELRSVSREADGKVVYTDVAHDAAPKVVNCDNHRVDRICMMEGWGLAPFYPIPSGPMEAEPNGPPGLMVRITSLKVQPARVEQRCRAEAVVSNGPAGCQAPPTVMSDSIMIRIFDSRGRLIFRAGHAWGGLKPGQPLCLNTDTHSNTLRAAGGKPFLFPEPGRYTLSVTACKGDSGKWTDSKSVTFTVGMDESEFRVLD